MYIEELAGKYDDAFYCFHTERFVGNYHALLAPFTALYPSTVIAYSYKTNYLPHACRTIDNLGGFAEVVSSMEYALAKKLNVSPSRIVFNGPVKPPGTLEELLLAGGLVNVDSLDECEVVCAIAKSHPAARLRVGIRCNFALTVSHESRFGIDVNGAEFSRAVEMLSGSRSIELEGLHCHFPMRDLESYKLRIGRMIDISSQIFRAPPRFLNIGGGYFGAVPEELRAQFDALPPHPSEYAKVIAGAMRSAYGSNRIRDRPLLILEPGTALVADTMEFVAKVISVKRIGVKDIVTVAGSVFNTCPTAKGIRLPMRVYRPGVGVVQKSGDVESRICGFTCIESDIMFDGCPVEVRKGDFVIFSNVGSYSVVMKPPFILPNVPIVDVTQNGDPGIILKRRETFEDVFMTYSF